jgi:hypothetical protein
VLYPCQLVALDVLHVESAVPVLHLGGFRVDVMPATVLGAACSMQHAHSIQ